MKAVVIYAPGGPEQLIYQEVPTPKIKEGWSLVRVRGFGLNHSEIFTREGKSPSVQFPRGIRAAAGRADLPHPPATTTGQPWPPFPKPTTPPTVPCSSCKFRTATGCWCGRRPMVGRGLRRITEGVLAGHQPARQLPQPGTEGRAAARAIQLHGPPPGARAH